MIQYGHGFYNAFRAVLYVNCRYGVLYFVLRVDYLSGAFVSLKDKWFRVLFVALLCFPLREGVVRRVITVPFCYYYRSGHPTAYLSEDHWELCEGAKKRPNVVLSISFACDGGAIFRLGKVPVVLSSRWVVDVVGRLSVLFRPGDSRLVRLVRTGHVVELIDPGCVELPIRFRVMLMAARPAYKVVYPTHVGQLLQVVATVGGAWQPSQLAGVLPIFLVARVGIAIRGCDSTRVASPGEFLAVGVGYAVRVGPYSNRYIVHAFRITFVGGCPLNTVRQVRVRTTSRVCVVHRGLITVAVDGIYLDSNERSFFPTWFFLREVFRVSVARVPRNRILCRRAISPGVGRNRVASDPLYLSATKYRSYVFEVTVRSSGVRVETFGGRTRQFASIFAGAGDEIV